MRLATTTVGDGPRHVGLVHGLGAEGATWGPLVDRMLATGRYRVTTVDLRGHGLSERAGSYRLADLADDVAETLPTGLQAVVGHSLGGSVLVRAVDRLRPERAVYLDPGFRLALPTTGLAGRAFWAVPVLTVGASALLQARKGAAVRASWPASTRALLDQAKARFDGRMAIGVFREVAHSPVAAAPPTAPSAVVLSDESPAVLPDALAAELEHAGWVVRRLDGLHHDMQLEDPDRVLGAIADLL